MSRLPVHNLSKQHPIKIAISRKDEAGVAKLKWKVTHNADFGQPGQLAYKLDTLIINRRIDDERARIQGQGKVVQHCFCKFERSVAG